MDSASPDLDPSVLACLADIRDPEIGLGIVELGLVYRASRQDRRIQVAITLTSRSCPLGDLILDDIRQRLRERFGAEAEIEADLVWEPRWTPDRMSAGARPSFSP